ncbi:hypothetical protein [Flavobacterium sp. AG291]|uniref:hypothetical protein n=1 Tax=Flavobacterium sp. AG291 TaxID=2184000 RepID=UPI0011C028D8|nr:hypothetical protein [Flavobacterium sp. AG291]
MSRNPLNAKTEQYKRLLKAFSVNALKTVFNLQEHKERQPELINRVIEGNTLDIILKTVFDNFSLLKQHVYIYDFRGTVAPNLLSGHPYFISTETSGGQQIFNLLFPIVVEFYNKDSKAEEAVDFLVPVQIRRKGTRFIVAINILERDIAALIDNKIVGAKRNMEDNDILNSFAESVRPIQLSPCDLNKGIKDLWDKEEIDASKAKVTMAKSVRTETLHGDFLLKRDLPAEYLKIIKDPIGRTTFEVLKQNHSVDAFVADPTKGIVYFAIFPKQHMATTDLIDLILSKN